MKKPLVSDGRGGIDLHVHSTASDGTLTPTEILALAVRLGLKAVAITDHDTLAGSIEARAGGIPSSLDFITGIEISAAAPEGYAVKGSVHVLGYGIDPCHGGLNKLIETLTAARNNRNPKIIERLNELGIDVAMDEVNRLVGGGSAGRPHIARLMVDKNMAGSIDDAFNRFLGKGQAAYVDKYRAPMDETIAAINQAGGIAVLAHPHLNRIDDPTTFESFLLTLIDMGLSGVEAIYPGQPMKDATLYSRLARKYDLLITGGTDFHGQVTPGIQLGIGDGSFHVPYQAFKDLTARLDK